MSVKIKNVTDETYMPEFKVERMLPHLSNLGAQYKQDVMNGDPHPLQSNDFIYTLTKIGVFYVDVAELNMREFPGMSKNVINDFTTQEVEVINSFCRDPKINWAIENSFDGLYIKKAMQSLSYKMAYAFYVYMEEKQATMWRLKYGSR